MTKNKDVTMSQYDFWNLRSAHERLAIKSGDVREIVLCAKVRLDNIIVGVTNSDRGNQLCYKEDEEHMYSAMRLLLAARDTQKVINSNQKEII